MKAVLEERSGLVLPAHVAQARRRPTCIDLFSGAGGFSLGVIHAGFEVVCAVEWSEWAAITYLLNLGQWPMRLEFATPADKARLNAVLEKHLRKTGTLPFPGSNRPPENPPVRSFLFGDIRHVTGDMLRATAAMGQQTLDTVCCSPPCQGFSTANIHARKGKWSPQNELVFEAARLIHELQPNTWIMENVPQIGKFVTPEGVPVLELFALIADQGTSLAEGLKRLGKPVHLVRRKLRKAQKEQAEPATSQASLF